MARLIYISHPAVTIRPDLPVPDWSLSPEGAAVMRDFCRKPVVAGVTSLHASTETKAQEAAACLADRLALQVVPHADMGEIDRSATGFLPPDEFEATADSFFASPDVSVRGWERAVDAQARIQAAFRRVLAGHAGGDLALVGHGAVGTLLWLGLSHRPISRLADQPSPGHYWTADLATLVPETGWLPLSET